MATKGQLKNAHKFVQMIQKSSPIHKFDLMDKLSISIATYNQLKPYIEYRFDNLVGYDRKSAMWTSKKVINVSEGTKAIQE